MSENAAAYERVLWVAAYALLVLAPLGLVYVAHKPGDDSFGVVLAAGLGFSGLTMIALQAVIPSRARQFSAPFGVDLLLRFHRQIGFAALGLVVAHVAILVIDDPERLALLDPTSAPLRALAGGAAVLALGLLTVTSLWRSDLGLRYEHWRMVHVALGVAVLVFAFGHVLGVSSYLAAGPIRWAMLLVALLAFGGLLHLRLGRPLAARRRAYRVRDLRPERGGAVTVELEADGHAGAPFRPGQFAWLKHAGSPLSMVEHPFSFSSSADRPDLVEFTVKRVGDFTDAMRRLEPGSAVLLDGPHGSFQPHDHDRGYVLVAGGVGITPAMSLLRTLADAGDRRPVELVYANRSWEGVTFRDELRALEDRLDLRVTHVLSDPHESWAGPRGRVDAALLKRVLPADLSGWRCLVCGPAGLSIQAGQALVALGVPRAAVHVERFAA